MSIWLILWWAALAVGAAYVTGHVRGHAHGYLDCHERVLRRRRFLRAAEASRLRRELEQWPDPGEDQAEVAERSSSASPRSSAL